MQPNTPVDPVNMSSDVPPAFFVVGGTLSRDAACYVTRKADEDLLKGLRQGQFCYVLTSRQMGKSSLMVRAATQLRQEGVAVAVLDLTAIGQNLTPEQWYDGLLNRIGRQLNIEDDLDDFWEDNERVGPMQRFMRALLEVVFKKVPGRIVIFIDEIDAVRSLPFSTDEFFAGIRECYNARVEEPDLRRLTFALFGVASPSDLIRDTRTTPFNIGTRIELKDFTPQEAAPLATGLGRKEEKEKRRKGEKEAEGNNAERGMINEERSPASSFASALNRILYWTNGHPYLTQRLCQALAEQAAATPHKLTGKDVDALCEELYLSPRARERDDNLLFVREWLLRSEVDTAGLLDLYAHIRMGKRIVDDETSRFVDVLRLSGVARSERGALVVRNRIYAHVFDRAWIVANMPDAELQRQRIAYRKGLLRALALSSLVVLMMVVLTAFAVKSARVANARELEALSSEAKASQAALRERGAKEEAQKAADKARIAAEQADIAAKRERQANDKAQQAAGNERKAKIAAESAGKQALQAAEASRRAEAEAQRQKKSAIAFAMKATSETKKATLSERREREQRERVERLAYPDSMSRAQNAFARSSMADGRVYLERYAHPGSPAQDLRGFDWRYLKRQSAGDSQRTFEGHQDSVHNLAVSPDGTLLASAGNDFIVQVRDLQTGQMLPAPHSSKTVQPFVAFSPDERALAVITDEKVLFWDIAAQKIRDTLPTLTPQGKILAMSSLAYSPDGSLLALGSYSGSVDIWNMTTHQKVCHLLHHPNGDNKDNPYPIDALAFSPNGLWLASAMWDHHGVQNSAKIWNVATQREASTLSASAQEGLGGDRVYSLAFARGGTFLATGGQDHNARIWNVSDPTRPVFAQKLVSHTNDVTDVVFSPDGNWLATGSSDGIRLWDASALASGGALREVTALHGHAKGVTCFAFTPDSRSLISGSQDKTLKIWNIASYLPAILPAHHSPVDTLAYSRDGKWLATGCTYAGDVVCVWNAQTRQLQFKTRTHAGGVCAAFAPDGKTIVVAGLDMSLTLYDVVTREAIGEFKGFLEPFNTVAFAPDGKTVATGGQLGTFSQKVGVHPWNGYHPRLWDVATRREILEFAQHQGHYGWPLRVAYSPDSKMLASGGGAGELRWWDVAGRRELGLPPRQSNGTTVRAEFAHQNNVFALAFSPDGKWLVTGSEDNTARLWDTRTRKPVATLLGHSDVVYGAAFSPDGKTLATGSRDGLIKLWSLATLRDGQVLDTISLPSDPEGVRCLTFSPDGNTLAVGHISGSVRFWQADALPPAGPVPAGVRHTVAHNALR